MESGSSGGRGRIEMLSLEDARKAAALAGLPPRMAELSVFRMLLRHPKLAQALNGTLGTLLAGEHLDARLRELVIMRIGWRTASVYEWTQHWGVARVIGMSEQEILGVRDWRRCKDYGLAERAVLTATDETIDMGTISRETWADCEKQLRSPEALLELVAAIGNWRLFSSLLRSLEVPLEEGKAPWPPDGAAPA